MMPPPLNVAEDRMMNGLFATKCSPNVAETGKMLTFATFRGGIVAISGLDVELASPLTSPRSTMARGRP